MQVDQFVLEYATPRAGDIDVVGRELSDRELGLGVVNPRTDQVESVEFLNTDCGFGCFASRSVNVEEVAFRKLCAIAKAASILRRRHG
jgi:5-methyltetrahydropteroyltriglutamate--homocysteine methyltransferase